MSTSNKNLGLYRAKNRAATLTTGNVFFVDSGDALAVDDTAHGDSSEHPFASLDFANTQCTASNGDIIYVMAGHVETVTNGTDLNFDVAGVTVIGLGEGRIRPLVDFTTADTADAPVSAANVKLHNLRFNAITFDSNTAMITVTAADVEISHCEFLVADSGQQVDLCITTNSDRLWVHDCNFVGDTFGPTSLIQLTATPDGVVIENNHMIADCTDACIQSAVVHTNVVVRGNYIENLNSGDHAIQFSTTGTGVIENNTLVTDAIATALDAGSCLTRNNKFIDSNFLDCEAVQVPQGLPATAVTGYVPVQKFISRTAVTTSMAGGFTLTDSPVTIFTVTGDVIVWASWLVVGGTAITSVSNLAVISLGVAGNTAVLQAPFTVASGAMAANDVWSNAGSSPGEELEAAGAGVVVSGDSTNIILTVATNNITAGVCDLYCIWSPVSENATVIGTTI